MPQPPAAFMPRMAIMLSGIHPSHAVAVGHLIEPVGRGDRADLDRFEKDVVARISGHVVLSGRRMKRGEAEYADFRFGYHSQSGMLSNRHAVRCAARPCIHAIVFDPRLSGGVTCFILWTPGGPNRPYGDVNEIGHDTLSRFQFSEHCSRTAPRPWPERLVVDNRQTAASVALVATVGSVSASARVADDLRS